MDELSPTAAQGNLLRLPNVTANWVSKALLQGAIGFVPRGHRLNYLLQTRVTRRLPRRGSFFDFHVETAARHHRATLAFVDGSSVDELHFFEFGAGWDLLGPLARWMMGVERQTVIDIRENASTELVNDTLRQLAERRDRLEPTLGLTLRRIDPRPIRTLGDLEPRFGIRYVAPCDARATAFPDASVDVVTSTFTLEHIPARDIASILREAARLLTPGGVVSSMIDFKDHFSYFEPRLSPYNFLQYSDAVWRIVNPSLQWQSRLRYSDHVRLFVDAGFELLLDEPERPGAEEIDALKEMRLARRFRNGYAIEDLGIKTAHLVGRPKSGHHPALPAREVVV